MYVFKRILSIILMIFIVIVYLYPQDIELIISWFSIENSPKIQSNHCSEYGFDDQHSTNNLPIYDFFIFNNELDMLEIRLYELYDYIHLFLIVESNRTLSGKIKPLYLKNNWSRFHRYHDKIRRIEVTLDNLINTGKTAWDNERRMRDEGIRLSLSNITTDFLLFTSDVDEIPKSRFVRLLKSCAIPRHFPPILLQCDTYCYSFEFLSYSSPFSPGATLSRIHAHESIPSDIRTARLHYRPVHSVCFHCSYCFDTVELVRLKLRSFSHTELDVDRYHNVQYIIDRFQHGKNLFHRFKKSYRRSSINQIELPRLLHVKHERERFRYMFNRSTMINAGFRDVNTKENSR